MNYYPLFMFTFFSVTVPVAGYLIEKQERIKFHEVKKYEESLSCYKKLIKEVIPCSIIIASKEEILFSNKETARVFAADNNESLKRQLKNILVEPNYESNSNCSIGVVFQPDERPSCEPSPVHPKREPATKFLFNDMGESEISKDLYSLLFNSRNLDSQKRNVCSYSGRMKIVVDSNPEMSLRQFDIKISPVIWKDQPASIVIINEDQMIERMDYLREQARYKDKLLATVSHDLRTPLNGMIGMLDTAYEAVEDKSIRKR